MARAGGREPDRPQVAVIEDEREPGELALEVCQRMGLSARQYRTSAAFQAAFAERRPDLVILDWRLEREVAAAVYLALRHRFEALPIVLWTGTGEHDLPRMVARDPHTSVVPKPSGLEALEAAIRGAFAPAAVAEEETSHDGGVQGPA